MSEKSEINAVIEKIKKDLEPSFSTIHTKYGYALKFGRGSYDTQGNFSIKLEATKDGAKSKVAQDYERFRMMLRLPPINTPMEFSGKKYTVTGINSRGSKVFIARDGKTWLTSPDSVATKWALMNYKETAELSLEA